MHLCAAGCAARWSHRINMTLCTTVNFAYNDTRRGIRKVALFAKCRYTRSLILCITVGWDFALGMEILSLFANCRYIRSRY